MVSQTKVMNYVFISDCKNAFGVICSGNTETRDRYNVHSFMADSDECTKKEFLHMLARNISNTICMTDFVSIINVHE